MRKRERSEKGRCMGHACCLSSTTLIDHSHLFLSLMWTHPHKIHLDCIKYMRIYCSTDGSIDISLSRSFCLVHFTSLLASFFFVFLFTYSYFVLLLFHLSPTHCVSFIPPNSPPSFHFCLDSIDVYPTLGAYSIC